MTRPAIDTCRYCGSPVAWLPRATGTAPVPLDPEPVPLATAHPAAPLYALRRDGAAVAVQDIHRPPAAVYVAHRCPQYGDALHAVDALSLHDELEAWMESDAPRGVRQAHRYRGTA